MRRGTTIPRVCYSILVGCLATLPTSVWAQVPNSRLGSRTAPILLLTRADVRDELRMNPEQVAGFRTVIAQLYDRAMTLQGRSDPQAVADRRAIDEAGQRWLSETLSDEQLVRLDQIDLQWEGPSALIHRPSVSAALNLTDTQRSALSKAIDRRERLLQAGEDRDSAEHELAEAALATLTPDQRARWKLMLGPAFQPSPEGSASR
ncbi:hypothetical protein BH23PLA1_BH23PLA1_38220 [soil metagenome]